MDTPDLEPLMLEAGRDFAAAMDNLGMDLSIVQWGYDKQLGHHVLLIVTDFFDYAGPLEISKAIFRAYNAAITPREIDPFIVQLYSTNQAFGARLHEVVSEHGWRLAKIDDATGETVGEWTKVQARTEAGIEIRAEWFVKRADRLPDRKTVDLSRRWSRFERNLARAAA